MQDLFLKLSLAEFIFFGHGGKGHRKKERKKNGLENEKWNSQMMLWAQHFMGAYGHY